MPSPSERRPARPQPGHPIGAPRAPERVPPGVRADAQDMRSSQGLPGPRPGPRPPPFGSMRDSCSASCPPGCPPPNESSPRRSSFRRRSWRTASSREGRHRACARSRCNIRIERRRDAASAPSPKRHSRTWLVDWMGIPTRCRRRAQRRSTDPAPSGQARIHRCLAAARG